jgi:hypothetical protein
MRSRFIILSFFILCISFAPYSKAAKLFAAEDDICLRDLPVKCVKGKEFFRTESKQCGCLSVDEYMSLEMCEQFVTICDETKDEYFMLLYKKLSPNNESDIKGCGCFGTYNLIE